MSSKSYASTLTLTPFVSLTLKFRTFIKSKTVDEQIADQEWASEQVNKRIKCEYKTEKYGT